MEDFGFNLCLLDEEEIPRAEAITKGIEQLEEIAAGLAAAGQSLRGCIMDIGFFPSPDTAMMSTTVSAGQCAKLGALGVDFEFTFYPSQAPAS
jgi:hypothetical protein